MEAYLCLQLPAGSHSPLIAVRDLTLAVIVQACGDKAVRVKKSGPDPADPEFQLRDQLGLVRPVPAGAADPEAAVAQGSHNSRMTALLHMSNIGFDACIIHHSPLHLRIGGVRRIQLGLHGHLLA
ncbi:hypothetical protein D3C76_1410210 [compost metagenome]